MKREGRAVCASSRVFRRLAFFVIGCTTTTTRSCRSLSVSSSALVACVNDPGRFACFGSLTLCGREAVCGTGGCVSKRAVPSPAAEALFRAIERMGGRTPCRGLFNASTAPESLKGRQSTSLARLGIGVGGARARAIERDRRWSDRQCLHCLHPPFSPSSVCAPPPRPRALSRQHRTQHRTHPQHQSAHVHNATARAHIYDKPSSSEKRTTNHPQLLFGQREKRESSSFARPRARPPMATGPALQPA